MYRRLRSGLGFEPFVSCFFLQPSSHLHWWVPGRQRRMCPAAITWVNMHLSFCARLGREGTKERQQCTFSAASLTKQCSCPLASQHSGKFSICWGGRLKCPNGADLGAVLHPPTGRACAFGPWILSLPCFSPAVQSFELICSSQSHYTSQRATWPWFSFVSMSCLPSLAAMVRWKP